MYICAYVFYIIYIDINVTRCLENLLVLLFLSYSHANYTGMKFIENIIFRELTSQKWMISDSEK